MSCVSKTVQSYYNFIITDKYFFVFLVNIFILTIYHSYLFVYLIFKNHKPVV